MAYAAASSLEWVLGQLYYSSDELANISFPESIPYIRRLSEIVVCIQAFDFEKHYPEAKSLSMEIRDLLLRAEDIIESYILNHFFSSDDDVHSLGIATNQESNFSQDLLRVVDDIESAKERLDQFADDVLNHGTREDSTSNFSWSSISSSDDLWPQCKGKMVGLEQELEEIKNILFSEPRQHLGAIVINGMGGMGKTSLAMSIYNDSDIRNQFPIVAWVKISLEHCIRDILLNLIRTVELLGCARGILVISHQSIEELDDKSLEKLVRKVLALSRYLVIVDCLCEANERSWEYIKSLLPDSNNGSRIILVNRMLFLPDNFIFFTHKKAFLDPKNSWDLLRGRVFGDEPCPRNLENIGKRIAENCKGLPLAIITVGTHLAKEEKTVEYWNKVSESGNSLAYKADGAPMFEQLGLSYEQLPQRLRLLFLYMGVFPENHIFPYPKLYILWVAEGFKTQVDHGTFRGNDFMRYLSNRNLVTYTERQNSEPSLILHHAMWHFCSYKAEEEEFFHVMDKCSPQAMNNFSIRRLVNRKTVIFAINNMSKFQDSLCSGIRSLHFTGTYHPYPLAQISWDRYKFLKVLNAFSIRLYEFPDEILCLNMLMYLSLTLNGGEIPPGISKMRRSLHFLIVHFHHIVRSSQGDPMYLRMEIWEMQCLIHLEVTGFHLPIPHPQSSCRLPNLQLLWGVSPHSCRKEVLERMPNLRGLRIRMDLGPNNDADGHTSCPFHHLALAKRLESLHYEITNPYFEEKTRRQVDAMPETFSISMVRLTILTLRGCGFPWEKIELISQLPSLAYLYLKFDAFKGPKWVLTSRGFKQLRALILEDLDLVYWTASSEDDQIFPRLAVFRISHCQKLQQIPLSFIRCPNLTGVDVTDINLEVENWARALPTELSHARRTIVSVSNPRGQWTITT